MGSEALRAVHDETGLGAAIKANTGALASINTVAKKIRALPATGFAGLAVKARVVLFDVYALGGRDEPKEDLGRGPQCLQRFAAEIEALAQ